MIQGIRTVAWKEWKALGDQVGIDGRGGITMLVVLGLVMGAMVPWMAGWEFLASPLNLFLYPFLGVSAGASPIMASFAGEK